MHEERNAPTGTKEMLATTADDDELQLWAVLDQRRQKRTQELPGGHIGIGPEPY